MSMFFILSGFVLAYRLHNGIPSYKNYAFNRFSRIYPAYFLAALVTLPWLSFSLAPYGYSELTVRYGFMVFLNLLMLQAWIPQLFSLWNFGASWSLCVEMFFYALFPFFINHLKDISKKKLYIGLFILYVATSFPGISYTLFNKNVDPLIFYAIPIFRVPEFLIGVISGLLFAKGIRFPRPNLGAILSATLLYVYLARGPIYGCPNAQHFVTIPLFAILLFSTASLSSGWLYLITTNRFFVYLGRISYSFYSFQALILMITRTMYGSIVSKFPIMANIYILSLVSFLVLLAIASISYHLVENKFRNYLNRKFAEKVIFKSGRLAIAS